MDRRSPAHVSIAGSVSRTAATGRGATGNGSITGTVKLTGTPPEMQMTKRQADPYCAKTPMKDEEVVVGAGGALKNVIVRIVKGITGNYEPPMSNVTTLSSPASCAA